jgi:hypothetical protein
LCLKLPCSTKKIKPWAKWNFDLEDCDNILRVDTPSNDAKGIIYLLQANGFVCEELMY